jgi:hypothetical protein
MRGAGSAHPRAFGVPPYPRNFAPLRMLEQLASVVGAILILAAYVALQTKRLGPESRAFNLMNAVGAALLTWVAVVDRRAGFIMLEGTWTLLSLIPLVRSFRRTRS